MITEDAVWSDEFTINAPAELVWDVLTDFARYEEWNPFCPQITTRLELGAPVEMMTDLGRGLQPQTEYMSRIEPPHCIAWAMENKPEDPVHACRIQYIKPIDASSCVYQTVDEFGGPGMAAMLERFGAQVERGFNNCGRGLKAQAEKLYQQGV